MKIGIVCALEREIHLIRERFGVTTEHQVGGIRITETALFENTVFLTVSGIGKTCAAMATQALISSFDCEIVFNTGLAGGCDARLCPGDAVLIKNIVYHDFDLGISDTFSEYKNGFSADKKLMSLAKEALKTLDLRYIEGIGASGDVFVNDKATKDDIVRRTGCNCVDMEAAAIAHVAAVNRIPAAMVKIISDSADENAAFDFEANIEVFAQRCVSLICEMAKQIK